MKKKLSIEGWNRKDHFHFFKQFDDPFFGVTVTIDCTAGYALAKENNISFFLYYMYQALLAANRTEPFRYRIHDEEVYMYDQVHASPTINRPDGTFGYAYMDFYENIHEFIQRSQEEIQSVQQSRGLVTAVSGENVIHFSSVPWIQFSSLSHARHFSFKDSCPKISFGKMTELGAVKSMPVSIHVHHALMDGYHVGQFIELFQENMNKTGLG